MQAMGIRRLPSLLSVISFVVASAGSAIALAGCEEAVPQSIVLSSAGEKVELVSEAPNPDIYVEIGEVSGRAMAVEKHDAFNAARNALRNGTAQKNGTIVRIDNVDAKVAWDVGMTVVMITGTAYRTK
jgi:hypothetical protein